MDYIDMQILKLLQVNCKLKYQTIAKRLGVAPSTIHFRIKKMNEASTIERFSVILDPEKVGFLTTAWIGLSVDPAKMDTVAKKLSCYDEIQVVSTASGSHDLLIQAVAKNEKDLWRFINKKIKTMEGVEKNFDVSCFLDVFKRTHIIKL